MENVKEDKITPDHVEGLRHVQTYMSEQAAKLSEEHRQYLVEKHGTYELDPAPDMSDADPYNWSSSKVRAI